MRSVAIRATEASQQRVAGAVLVELKHRAIEIGAFPARRTKQHAVTPLDYCSKSNWRTRNTRKIELVQQGVAGAVFVQLEYGATPTPKFHTAAAVASALRSRSIQD